MDIQSFILGYQKGKASSGGGGSIEPENTVLFEPTVIGEFSGPTTHPTTGLVFYQCITQSIYFTLSADKMYTVNWDSIEWKCPVKVARGSLGTALVIGNLYLMNLGEDTGEPFLIMPVETEQGVGVQILTTDDETTHTMGLSATKLDTTVLLEPMAIGPFEDLGNGAYGFECSLAESPVTIESGKAYIVDWNGMQYTVSCVELVMDDGSMLYLGNPSLLGVSEETTNEPFCIAQAGTVETDGFMAIATTSEGATNTIGLSIVNAQNEITVEPLTVTENGTFTAPEGTAYNPVTVNVAGGGTANWVSATGNVAGTGGNLVITHGLGVVPDIFYFYVTPQVQSGEKSPIMQLGFSQAMIDAFGEDLKKFGGFMIMQNDDTVYNFQSSAPIDVTTAPGLGRMYNANESTILIPHYSTMPLSTAKTVTWYAVGGITG